MTAQNVPGPMFDPHRAAIRERGHRVTPYRIGLEVGRRGENLANPYLPGSVAASNYREGLKWTRMMQKARENGPVVGTTYQPGIGWMYTVTRNGQLQGRYGNFETEGEALRAGTAAILRSKS